MIRPQIIRAHPCSVHIIFFNAQNDITGPNHIHMINQPRPRSPLLRASLRTATCNIVSGSILRGAVLREHLRMSSVGLNSTRSEMIGFMESIHIGAALASPGPNREAQLIREIGSIACNNGKTKIMASAVAERLTFQATHYFGEG
jgi:hypothetical protein